MSLLLPPSLPSPISKVQLMMLANQKDVFKVGKDHDVKVRKH